METIDDPYPERFLFFFLEIFASPGAFYLINGIILVLLLGLSALASGAEVAFFSLAPEQVANFKNSPDIREQKIFKLVRFPRKLLATILVLNNLANMGVVILSTYLAWNIFGAETTGALFIVALAFVITFLIVFFGEVMPKVYANQNNTTFAKRVYLLLGIAQTLVYPISYVLLSITNFIDKRLRKKSHVFSVEDLNQALEIATDKDSTEEEKDILKGIVTFGTLSVKQVMRSRLDITAFDIDLDFHELMDKINKSGYSRIPIYRETIDKIEGILYIKDLLPYIDEEEDFKWQKLLRQGYFVPEGKKIDDLLKDFQDKRVHMALVVDEYGGVSGLITMEDIIEEIVGEINDELDDDEVAFNKLDENTFVFEGKTSLNDFCKIVGEDPALFETVKGDSESLGGLILELNSKLPRAGDKIRFNKFVFTVVAVDNKRIKRVRVFIQAATVKKNRERV